MKVIISLIAAVLLLTSCTNSTNGRVDTDNEAPPIASAEAPSTSIEKSLQQNLSATDLSIEGIRIGGSIDDVVKSYGQPSEKTVSHGLDTPYWIFKEQGIYIDFDGPIWQATVTPPFKGKTPRGISIGSSTEDVLKAYPDITTGDSYIQKSADGQYSIQFSINNGMVTQINMWQDKTLLTDKNPNETISEETPKEVYEDNSEQPIEHNLESNLTNNYSLTINKKNITLKDWDNTVDLQKILGEPTSQNIEILGNEADTHKGSFIKTMNYDGLQIKLMSPKENGKDFWILEMVVTKKDYKTSKGIEIGDKLEKVKNSYPDINIALD
ncbi:hypothetical protein PghCCS26_60050 [Paenibacillus glycanilyticus]|uniref:Lipoprotein n=1 Tax=Paenibacillus glycanilyticus TaxID=126569 RepID=A0ABQ6NUW0_9BACL|nr:hypothetical protein [Paenibacillus glycanilyticus]GMK48875.1 hypothetical protein PghCCS26_60050 [Paenibacillus glycanilyticus]